MNSWKVWVILIAGSAPTFGACGSSGRVVRDWGLHAAWSVQRDCAHPERPARLVEIPWLAARGSVEPSVSGTGFRAPIGKPAPPSPPAVRSGMRVRLEFENDDAAVHLAGVALGTARVGERVGVRAGWSGVALQGVVTGPATVEMRPGKAMH